MAYLGNQPVVGDSANSFKTLDDIASFTVTFDATSSDVVSIANDTLTFNNHRFVTAQKVTYNDGGGTAIGGLADGSYFIIKEDQNTIKLATSAANAASGTAINLTSGAAGGSHTLKIAFDGVNTKFKATFNNGTKANISRAAQLSLSINGVIQQPQDTTTPTVGYGIEADSTIVFSTAPEATDKVFGSFIGEVAASFDIADNTVDEFTANGSTTSFTLSKEIPSNNDALVTLDGVVQYPDTQTTTRAYSTKDNTITFTSAPAAGVIIQVRHIGFAGAASNEVTAFYGRTGNVQLKNTDNVDVNNLTAAGTVTVAGNLDVTGDITYDETVARNLNITGIATVASGIVSTGDFKIGTATTLSQDNIFTTGIVTATSFSGSGANLTALPAANLTGTLPALDGSNLTGVASTENIRTNTNATFLQNVTVVGTSTVTGNIVPSSDSATDIGTNSVRFQNAYVDNYYGSGANLTGLDFATTADINNLINNVAMLGFKVAANGSLAKFDLVDQVVDEYNSSAGIDASASTNETLTSGYYVGNVAGGSATGGTITTYGSYKVHSFLSSGTFTVPTGYSGTADLLIVAGGGGGGGAKNGGGGGAGGMVVLSSQTITAQAYTVTVGAGGAGGAAGSSNTTFASSGGNSSVTGFTVAVGGGGGANKGRANTLQSPSGGSAGGHGNGGSSGAATSGQGNVAGGDGGSGGSAGGGGAGEAGGTDGTRHGGDGATNSFRTGSAVTYAGGGSGGEDGSRPNIAGGDGGGGTGKGDGTNGGDATANTGGGGGGSGENTNATGGDGGSGIVVIRYNASTGLSGPADLTLQSTDSTALSAPSTADLVMLIEDGVGTATLNTDVKAFISRDSGSNFTQGTLVEEGTWGASTKRIVAFHNLDISSQPSGTSICYKITTHNQSGSKETRIHAVSHGWK